MLLAQAAAQAVAVVVPWRRSAAIHAPTSPGSFSRDGESRELLAKGPFTLTVTCELNLGVDDGTGDIFFFDDSSVTLATNADNQAYALDRGQDRDPDFDASASPRTIFRLRADPGETDFLRDRPVIIGSDGTELEAHLWTGTNLFGTPGCHFGGYIDSK